MLIHYPAACYFLILLAVLSPSSAVNNVDGLDIQLHTGTFRGFITPNGTEAWLGIPFAQPPVGLLRFKAPRPLVKRSKLVKNATAFGNACPQAPSNVGAPIAEDCLFLNIYRPPGFSRSNKLPVLVWLHGGAYTHGAASDPATNPERILQFSVDMGKPIIFVSLNYRMNTFGFLASASMDPRDLNAGLQDQRLALEFLQENIHVFGGDPTKVTLWGQSAGAGSAHAHVLFPSNKPLFRAVIANSATGPFKNAPGPSIYDQPDKSFGRLLSATGCSAGRGALACLQGVPFEALLGINNAMVAGTLNGQLWEPTVHPANFINQRPSDKILSGKFLHVPYLGGTNLNEGTFFSGTVRSLNLSGEAEVSAFNDFIFHLLVDNTTVTNDVMDEFRTLFPANDPSLGTPFNTGDSLFDRAVAWYTDEMFLGPRRFFFEKAASLQPMFAYHFKEFIPGNDPTRGVSHATELPLLFGPVPTSIENTFADQFLNFYINFVHDTHPGPTWPRYTFRERKVLQLLRGNITVIPDDWDAKKIDFINSKKVLSEFQK